TPLTLTLLAGPPRGKHAEKLTAYVAIQSATSSCARSPAADHRTLIDLGQIYDATKLIANQTSPLAPTGGAARGVHARAVNGIEIAGGPTSVLACTWLDTSPTKRARPRAQQIPMLGGLFAAAVWASGTPVSSY